MKIDFRFQDQNFNETSSAASNFVISCHFLSKFVKDRVIYVNCSSTREFIIRANWPLWLKPGNPVIAAATIFVWARVFKCGKTKPLILRSFTSDRKTKKENRSQNTFRDEIDLVRKLVRSTLEGAICVGRLVRSTLSGTIYLGGPAVHSEVASIMSAVLCSGFEPPRN